MTRVIQFYFILKVKGRICVIVKLHFEPVTNLSIEINIDFFSEIEGCNFLHPNRDRRIFNSGTHNTKAYFNIALWFYIYNI